MQINRMTPTEAGGMGVVEAWGEGGLWGCMWGVGGTSVLFPMGDARFNAGLHLPITSYRHEGDAKPQLRHKPDRKEYPNSARFLPGFCRLQAGYRAKLARPLANLRF